MGIRTRNMELGAISNEILASSSSSSGFSELPSGHVPVRCKEGYVFETFNTPFVTGSDTSASGMTAATGTAGDVNHILTRFNAFEYHIIGTQTITTPGWAGTGMDIGMDQTSTDGVEITHGCEDSAGAARTNVLKFTIGTSAAFFFRVKASIADVSGVTDFAVGFRKLEAYQADIDGYDELVALVLQGTDIEIHKILNNAATSETDTTQNWADTETHTLQVNISAAGAATFKIDDADPTATTTFTFDSGEVVIPFVYLVHGADVAGAVVITEWECGFQDPGSY